jgi:hypothetical protein
MAPVAKISARTRQPNGPRTTAAEPFVPVVHTERIAAPLATMEPLSPLHGILPDLRKPR